jgi:hypothetical protein
MPRQGRRAVDHLIPGPDWPDLSSLSTRFSATIPPATRNGSIGDAKRFNRRLGRIMAGRADAEFHESAHFATHDLHRGCSIALFAHPEPVASRPMA